MDVDRTSATGEKVMPKKPQYKNVVLKFDGKTWTMGPEGGLLVSPREFAPILIDYGHVGKITFKIIESPSNVTFADQNPITVLPFTDWNDKPNSVDAQFTIEKNSQTELMVRDLNGHPGNPHKGYKGGHFNYVLHFDNAPPIDPIISNSGCCRPTGFLDFPELGGAAVLALLAVAARPMLKKHRSRR